jgi:general secretion pathway protein D
MGSLSSAAWTPQEQERPATEAERKRLLERLTKQIQESQQGTKPAPAAPQPQPALPVPTAPAAAPPPIPPAVGAVVQQQSGKVWLNLENADLYDFINQIAGTLGLSPIVIDPEVRGSVNILSTGPMLKEDVLPLFNLILKNNNAALIKHEGVYQIVPISSALKKGVEIIEQLPEPAAKPEAGGPTSQNPAESSPNPATMKSGAAALAAARKAPGAASAEKPEPESSKTPRLATHVIRAEFVPVKDLIEPVKLFMTEGGVVMPYERLNMLILTDYTDSAARVLQIIRMLDTSFLDPDLVDLIKIHNNASADVVDDLKKIFGSGAKESPTGISFVSLDRLNAIFVIASSKRGLEEVKRWIKELDASSGRNIQTYVYVVENSTASNIATMLAALYGGEETSVTAPGGAGTGGMTSTGRYGQAGGTSSLGTGGSAFGASQLLGAAASALGGQTSFQGSQAFNNAGGGFMGGTFGVGQRLGPQLNPSRGVSSQILRGGTFTGLQDTVRLVVDDVNNSLIIQATAADYAYLSETIKKLDVLPRQAIIDARIFEVDLTDNLSYGVSAALQATTSSAPLTTAGIDPSTGALSANTFAFVGNAREILLALNALRQKTKVKILEAPSVLALDGTMATITVGAEIPYPGSSYIAAAGGSSTSVGYRDTGISLLVMPRISASGSVTMDITQEVSSPGASLSVGSGETAPSFSKTSVTTTLSVKDGETVAIAGLIRDSNSFSRTGIPLLAQIPLIGSLFGQTTRTVTRSELIILITPHVIRTVDKFQEMTQELKDSLRNVRKLENENEKAHIQDMEDARKDRYREELKNTRDKSAKPKPEKMEEP